MKEFTFFILLSLLRFSDSIQCYECILCKPSTSYSEGIEFGTKQNCPKDTGCVTIIFTSPFPSDG